jgi:cell division septation protein DedD
MTIRRKIKPLFLLVASLGTGCALWDDGIPKKSARAGLIATPATYYSTAKARYLGTKYKDNLDRLAERIVRNSNTSQLQFANNISSVGGIGFFTHSATKAADERYLEVVLSTPETFESKGEYSEKVNRLFSRFGHDLLAILAGDTQIYQDKELAGYGLNLTWRTVISEAPANRIAMARAIIYFNKERVSSFLRKDVGQNELLSDAVIFAVEEDGPLNLVSYQPRETKPDFRPAIREDNLVAGAAESKPSRLAAANQAAKEPKSAVDPKIDTAQKELSAAAVTKARPAAAKPVVVAESETKASPPAAKKELPPVSRSAESTKPAAEIPPTKLDSAPERLALAKPSAEAAVVSPAPEAQPQPGIALSKPISAPSATARSAASETNQPDKTKAGDAAPAISSSVKTQAEQKPPAKPVEVRKTDPKLVQETAKPTPPVVVSKASIEGAKTPKSKAVNEIAGQEIVPLPVAKPSAALPALEAKTLAPVPAVAKLASSQPATGPVPAPTNLTPRETEAPVKPSEPAVTPAASAKTEEVARPRTDTVARLPIAKVTPPRQTKPVEPTVIEAAVEKPLEVKDRPVAPSTAAMANTPAAAEPVVKTLTPEPIKAPQSKSPAVTALRPAAEKTSAAAASETATAGVTKSAQRKVADAPAVDRAPDKSAESAVARKIEAPVPPLARLPQAKSTEPPQARSAVEQLPEPAVARKSETPAPALGIAKIEPAPALKPESKRPIAGPVQENANEKPEQVALLRKPAEPMVEKPPLVRPALKPLEGFIIQVAFNDKEKAQGWAEKMQQRGYAVSVTEAGAEGSLRVRLGNFAMRDEAERQLRNFKQEGMSGIIINLPQAFRPEARSSLP